MQKPLIDEMDGQDNGQVPPKPGFKKTKVGWIPEEWKQAKLQEITSDLQTGPFGSKLKASEYVEDGIPVINPSNIENDGIHPDWSTSVTKEKREELSRYVLREGDIVLARRGEIGRCAKVTSKEHGWVCGTGCLIVRPDEGKVNPDFLELAFATKRTLYWLESESVGSTMSNLSTRIVSDTPIPFPPLHEQHRIAEILSSWDRAIEQIDDLIATKERRKRALMQQLLTGKTRLPGFGGCEWCEVRVKNLGEVVTGGTPKTSTAKYWGGNIAWCTPTDITACPGKNISRTERTLTDSGIKNSSATVLPPDSLIVCTRATVGDCAVNTVPMATNQGFKSIIPSDDADVDYLHYWFSFFKHELVRLGAGSTFLEVSKEDFSRLKIDVPTLPEQRAIAAVLTTCDDEIEMLREERDALQLQKKGMMQKLLKGKVRVSTDITSPQVEA